MEDLDNAAVLSWDADQVSRWVSGMGLSLYSHHFYENNITGDTLVHLDQTDLGDIGVQSVGHRLRILKAVYELIVKQNIQVDGDHYIPPTVLESSSSSSNKSLKNTVDPSIVHSFEIRDERINYAETEIRRLMDSFQKLREDLLPIFRMAKENKPLPTPDLMSPHASSNNHPTLLQPQPQSPSFKVTSPPSSGSTTQTSGATGAATSLPHSTSASSSQQPSQSQSSSSLNNSSTNAPSASSTLGHTPGSTGAGQTLNSTSHSSSLHREPSSVKRIISKSSLANLPLSSRSPTSTPGADWNHYKRSNNSNNSNNKVASSAASISSNATTLQHQSSSASSSQQFNPFKSFKVSMDEPCRKVLPAALKKYNLTEPWENYVLLVCYGDQERSLGPEEKPLLVFKELQDAGQRPVFMLRHSDYVNKPSNSKGGVLMSGTPGGVL